MYYFDFAASISYHQQGPASTSYIGRVRLHTLGGRALSVTGSAVGTAAALVGSASGTSTLGFSTRSLPKFDDGARTFEDEFYGAIVLDVYSMYHISSSVRSPNNP